MDWLFPVSFLVILGMLGYDDWKTRKFPDIGLAFLWGTLGIPYYLNDAGASTMLFAAAAVAFTITYLIFYSGAIALFKKPLIGMGDVLLFPPCCAFLGLILGPLGIGIAFMVLGVTLIYSYRKAIPFGTVMLFVVLICAAFAYGPMRFSG